MTPEQFQQIQKGIEKQIKDGIEFHVNGKTRAMMTKLDEYIKDDTSWKEKDSEWKAEVKPYIESWKQFSGFTATGATLLKAVMLIGGAAGVIWGLFRFIANIK